MWNLRALNSDGAWEFKKNVSQNNDEGASASNLDHVPRIQAILQNNLCNHSIKGKGDGPEEEEEFSAIFF